MIAFRLGSACAVVAFSLWAPTAADAQADAAFRAGLSARDDKRWPVVETEMRRAILANPQESDRRVGAGMIARGTQYLPYFFLGEALFHQQNCAGAMDAWAISEQQGAVRSRTDFLSIIKAGYSSCASRGILLPADYAPRLSSTTDAVTKLTEQAERLTKVEGLSRPEMRDQYNRAYAELDAAHKHLKNARQGRARSEFDAAQAASDRAAALLRDLQSTLAAAAAAESATIVEGRTEAEQFLARADDADRALEELKPLLTPALTASRHDARRLAEQARLRLEAPTPASLTEALQYARDASAASSQVLDQARQLARSALQQRFGEAVAAATEAFSFVDASFATLDRLAVERPRVGTANLASERDEVGNLKRQFEAARKAGNLAKVQEVTRLASAARDRLNTLMAAFGPVSLRDRGVHPALEEGARLFLSGEHQQALSVLDGVTAGPEAQPLMLHVHLFRAAAAFALFVRSGETDQALHQQAVADVERCKQISPSFVPDAGAFAPRFIRFFQATGRIPGQGEGTASGQ